MQNFMKQCLMLIAVAITGLSAQAQSVCYDENNVTWPKLKNALDAGKSHVTLISNVTEEDLTIYSGTTLDLNSYTINGPIYVDEDATLDINSGTVNGQITAEGTFIMAKGSISADDDVAIVAGENSTITISGGTVTGTGYCMSLTAGTKATVTGGSFITNSPTITEEDKLGIEGQANGTFYKDKQSIFAKNSDLSTEDKLVAEFLPVVVVDDDGNGRAYYTLKDAMDEGTSPLVLVNNASVTTIDVNKELKLSGFTLTATDINGIRIVSGGQIDLQTGETIVGRVVVADGGIFNATGGSVQYTPKDVTNSDLIIGTVVIESGATANIAGGTFTGYGYTFDVQSTGTTTFSGVTTTIETTNKYDDCTYGIKNYTNATYNQPDYKLYESTRPDGSNTITTSSFRAILYTDNGSGEDKKSFVMLDFSDADGVAPYHLYTDYPSTANAVTIPLELNTDGKDIILKSSSSQITLNNKSKLTVNSAEGETSTIRAYVNVKSGATLVVEDGTINCTSTSRQATVVVASGATATISGGTINANSSSRYAIKNSGTVSISGGTLGTITNAGTMSISGGTFATITNTSTLTITGGTFGFDPTDYVPGTGYDVIDNGDNTWTVKTHIHSYGEPVWEWTGYTAATATFTCVKGDDTQVKDAVISSEITTEATCTTDGVRTYTATVSFNGETFTTTLEETIPATGHTYGTTPTWSWTGYTAATASFTCTKGDDTQVKDATITSEITTPATTTSTGVRTYTATVEFNGQTYTDQKTEIIPILSYEYIEAKKTIVFGNGTEVTKSLLENAINKFFKNTDLNPSITTTTNICALDLRQATMSVAPYQIREWAVATGKASKNILVYVGLDNPGTQADQNYNIVWNTDICQKYYIVDGVQNGSTYDKDLTDVFVPYGFQAQSATYSRDITVKSTSGEADYNLINGTIVLPFKTKDNGSIRISNELKWDYSDKADPKLVYILTDSREIEAYSPFVYQNGSSTKATQGATSILEFVGELDGGYVDIVESPATLTPTPIYNKADGSKVADLEGNLKKYWVVGPNATVYFYSKDVMLKLGEFTINTKPLRAQIRFTDSTAPSQARSNTAFSIDELPEQFRFYGVEANNSTTDINSTTADETEIAAIYTLNGTRVDAPVKGVNIIRYKNGKTNRVVVE